MSNISQILQGCLQALNTTNAQDIIFEQIYTGSTIVTGSGQVQGGSVTQAAQTFSNTIAAGIPGTSYSARSVNVQYSGQISEETSESNLKIIIIAAVSGVGLICTYIFM